MGDREPGYECFDAVIQQLRTEGHRALAERLDQLLHRTAWTTSSELLGELGLELLRVQRVLPNVSQDLQGRLDACMTIVRRHWPAII